MYHRTVTGAMHSVHSRHFAHARFLSGPWNPEPHACDNGMGGFCLDTPYVPTYH